MASETKVVRVKSFKDLPEVVRPGTYVIGSGEDMVKLTLKEELSRDEVIDLVEGIKEMHRRYYG